MWKTHVTQTSVKSKNHLKPPQAEARTVPALTNKRTCSRAHAPLVLPARDQEPHAGLSPRHTSLGEALPGVGFESLPLTLPLRESHGSQLLLRGEAVPGNRVGEVGFFYLRKGFLANGLALEASEIQDSTGVRPFLQVQGRGPPRAASPGQRPRDNAGDLSAALF